MIPAVHALWQRARGARLRQAAWLLLPAAIAAIIAIRPFAHWAVAFFAAALLGCGLWLWRAWRAMDARWLVRQLNDERALHDSADLLLADTAALNPLQQRLRGQLESVVATRRTPLATPFPRRGLALSLISAAALVALSVWARWPSAPATAATPAATVGGGTSGAAVPVVRAATLAITPPAYTGIGASRSDNLDAKAPQGSRLQWRLRLEPQATDVRLQFHDGQELVLRRDGTEWIADATLQRSRLYRVVTAPALADAPLHRLDAIADAPPQLQVVQPAQTLSAGQPGQRRWTLVFDASDDYAVAANAQLRVTVTEGSGENIRFREQVLTLGGSGSARQRRFQTTLDPSALGVGPGDDLIAQLTVADNHQPQPQATQGPALILRMPSEAEQQSSDLEGAIKKVMPAYFRSQRQIIIDAEALLKQQRTLEADAFIRRSDAIGVDQRLLRLRYGQFLGEEAEGGITPPAAGDLPTADAAPTADAGHAHDDGHDHGDDKAASGGSTPVFGSATDVLSEYGHTHDHAEAATLLDPQTRATLKAALDAMWLSEGELRQGRPQQALPHAYKALGLIKQVQQAERIYLARLGPELPPIDPTRRLGGKRDGIASRRLALPAAASAETTALQAWQQLGQPGTEVDLAALARWLSAHERELADPLALAAAIETLRASPACDTCRQALRAALWAALTRPPASVPRRQPADEAGRRYLHNLQEAAR